MLLVLGRVAGDRLVAELGELDADLGRGAAVLAIVNRRGSDLTDKADGVLYTSDGRDVEMSVASTKAFYAQCAAGQLLALALARAAGCHDDAAEHELLQALVSLPDAMRAVLAQDARITEIARTFAPQRTGRWSATARTGSPRPRSASSSPSSATSRSPATRPRTRSTSTCPGADDPVLRGRHDRLDRRRRRQGDRDLQGAQGVPIVVATAGESRFDKADGVIEVPASHPALAYILSTMAGHLFGYRAALAIDEPRRRCAGCGARSRRPSPPSSRHRACSARSRRRCALERVPPGLLAGRYDGTLEARTAARLTSLCNCAMFHAARRLPGGVRRAGRAWRGGRPVRRADQGHRRATRPVDAIKHQAKTVTVGISRTDEALLTAALVRETLAAGAERTTSATSTCARSPASIRPSARCSAAPATASKATWPTTRRRSTWSTAAASRPICHLGPTPTRPSRGPSTWSPASAADGRAGTQRRPHGGDRPGGRDNRPVGLTLLHVRSRSA